MKIIDLLNKIANGEEVPKKIKVFGGIYYLCKGDSSEQLYFSEKQGYGGIGLKFNTSQINDEVEVIEDNKKIEMLDIELSPDDGDKVNGYLVCEVTRDLAFKINEIIEVLNEK